MLKTGKVFLGIDYGVEISTIAYVYLNQAQVRAFHTYVFGSQVRGHVGKLYATHLSPFLLVFNQNQSGWGFHTDDAWYLGCNQPFFYGDCNGTYGSMSAHGQASAGLNKQHSHIIGRIMGWIKDGTAHHIMAPGFEHKPFPDPVIFTQEMLTLFAHVVSFQMGSSACNQPNGITAGVGVNAKKCFFHYLKLIKDGDMPAG
jgi:hypothetical protein